jgi:voltage-gated potassium channel
MTQSDITSASFPIRKIGKGFGILLVVLAFGTTGYMLIEKWSFLDSLYMTVITITTVGYREMGPMSPAGMVFTIFVVFSGMGLIIYILGAVAQAMVEFQLGSVIGRRKLLSKIRSTKNHYVICGFGRIGRIICRELETNHIPMVVIDNGPGVEPAMEREEVPIIHGDATSEDILMGAGIERARGLVSVVRSDADNVFITMSARGLNPNLFILSRAEEEHTEKKLMRAGANRVVMPYHIGGQKMAHAIIKPVVSDFLELTVHNRKIGLEMGEVVVSANSKLSGVNLADSGIRQQMDVIIIAVQKKDGEMKFNPSSQTQIESGDTLIALGQSEDISRLAKILSGENAVRRNA